jgi:hypothetical protein
MTVETDISLMYHLLDSLHKEHVQHVNGLRMNNPYTVYIYYSQE